MSQEKKTAPKRNKRKRERDNESESSDAFSREQDEEPDTGLPRNLRSLLLPDIDVPKRSDTTSNFIFPKSHATNERIDRLGDSTKQYFEQRIHDTNVTSLDSLPSDGLLDAIHTLGMRMASTSTPPRFRLLQPNALLALGLAAQQMVLHRLQPLLMDHAAMHRVKFRPTPSMEKPNVISSIPMQKPAATNTKEANKLVSNEPTPVAEPAVSNVVELPHTLKYSFLSDDVEEDSDLAELDAQLEPDVQFALPAEIAHVKPAVSKVSHSHPSSSAILRVEAPPETRRGSTKDEAAVEEESPPTTRPKQQKRK